MNMDLANDMNLAKFEQCTLRLIISADISENITNHVADIYYSLNIAKKQKTTKGKGKGKGNKK